MNERVEIATIHYDPECKDEIERANKLQEQLRKIGIVSVKSASYSDEYSCAPPMPWLDLGDQRYYSYQLSTVLERLSSDHAPPHPPRP